LPVLFQWDERSHLREGLQTSVLIRAQHRHHRSTRGDEVRQELGCHPLTIHNDPRLYCFSRRLFIAGQDRRQPHRQVLVTSMGGGEAGMTLLIVQEDQGTTAQDLA
jgi:hypothetical protein